jgi:hypothetical protein
MPATHVRFEYIQTDWQLPDTLYGFACLSEGAALKRQFIEPARAISVMNPWAWRIVAGLEGVVEQAWKPSWRGMLWIHASADSDLSAPAELWPSARQHLVASAIIGHVTLADVQGRPGAWQWVVTDPRQLAEPVTGVRGHPGLWLIDLPPRLATGGERPRRNPAVHPAARPDL